jgi:hypothetical protein
MGHPSQNMPRTLSPAVLAQVLAAQLRPALFLEIAFLTETIWLWSGLGPTTPPGPAYGTTTFPYGQTFLGMGWLGQIQAVPAVTDVIAQNITLVLSGIPTELVTDAINAVRQNSTATLWVAMLDGSNNVIGDPVQVFAGSLDVPTLVEGAETSSISITAENPLIDLNRAPERRFTDIDQQTYYPGDTGFFAVQLLQDYNWVWPTPTPNDSGYVPPAYLTIAPQGPVLINPGSAVNLVATEIKSDGSNADITAAAAGGWWTTTNAAVATVDQNGIVTAVAQGMCVVSKGWNHGEFTHSDISSVLSASVTIIVVAP